MERAWPGFNTGCARHYLPTPRHKISSSMRRPTSRAGITLVSLKRRRSSARNDAGRSAICLSSNRHDRGNEQQTSGVARARGPRGGQRTRRIKIEIIDAERQSPTQNDSKSIDRFFIIPPKRESGPSSFCVLPRTPAHSFSYPLSREGTGLSGQLKSVARLLPCSTDLSRTASEKRAPLRPSRGRGRAPGASEMRHPTGARTRAPKGAGG